MARLNNLLFAKAVIRAAAIASAAVAAGKHIPRQLKWFFVFLIALNIRNFPLVWHFRILAPWFGAIWKGNFKRRIDGPKGHLKHLTSISPIGRNPFDKDIVEVYRTRAGIADCDYNGHLSNSSYAKNLDQVRMEACVTYFPGFSRAGGVLMLGGGYFHFIKEIPLNAQYEIRFYISGWDEKWVYLTGAFVTYPKHKRHNGKGEKSKAQTAAENLLRDVPSVPIPNAIASAASAVGDSVVIVPPVTEGEADSLTSSAFTSGLTTPANGINGNGALSTSLSSSSLGVANGNANGSAPARAFIHPIPIPENAILHATTISQYCYKHGRVTVPPRVALITSGFGSPERAKERWEKLLAIRDDPKKMKALLRGEWRNEDGGGLGKGFWDFEEYEAEGLRRGAEIRRVRDVMDALAGK